MPSIIDSDIQLGRARFQLTSQKGKLDCILLCICPCNQQTLLKRHRRSTACNHLTILTVVIRFTKECTVLSISINNSPIHGMLTQKVKPIAIILPFCHTVCLMQSVEDRTVIATKEKRSVMQISTVCRV